jgi:hypothetical protein
MATRVVLHREQSNPGTNPLSNIALRSHCPSHVIVPPFGGPARFGGGKALKTHFESSVGCLPLLQPQDRGAPDRKAHNTLARSPGVTPGYADLESALIFPINPPSMDAYGLHDRIPQENRNENRPQKPFKSFDRSACSIIPLCGIRSRHSKRQDKSFPPDESNEVAQRDRSNSSNDLNASHFMA